MHIVAAGLSGSSSFSCLRYLHIYFQDVFTIFHFYQWSPVVLLSLSLLSLSIMVYLLDGRYSGGGEGCFVCFILLRQSLMWPWLALNLLYN